MNGSHPRVLLLGYGGANNTGAEIRILTIVEDVRAAFGMDATITVGTVNPEKTRRFLPESDALRLARIPYVFPAAVWRLARDHDVTLLVEGSTFKENWSSALLYLFLWGARCAHWHGRRCVAYAVDAGRMRPLNRRLTRTVCRDLDLLITRTGAARDQLREFGVTREIAVTTDTAFQFATPEGPRRPPSAEPVVGLAPVDFHQWPVRVRLWGPKAHCYHWPYYFSWDRERAAASDRLVRAWAALATHVVRHRGAQVRLIAMEELDGRICDRIVDAVDPDLRPRVTTLRSGERTPPEIVAELRRLDYLLTSRYHACVLSMASSVPQGALYHDERLISIYRELGLADYALPQDTEDLDAALVGLFERIRAEAPALRGVLAARHDGFFLPSCRENRALLARWAAAAFPGAPVPVPEPA